MLGACCKRTFVSFGLLLLTFSLTAQMASVSGRVTDKETGAPVAGASVVVLETQGGATTAADGTYRIETLRQGQTYTLRVVYVGKTSAPQTLTLTQAETGLDFEIETAVIELDETDVEGESGGDRRYMRAVEGHAIYASKKTEVIKLDNVCANKATNNTRQIYAKVPGLNIWESDGAGLQLGIGARGLNPNRTSNFNTRQNGYDMSADALGYPESYYSPPTEAIDRIEIVRGAASLQYGTQFGGMLNFVFKTGPTNKRIELTSRQTLGSFGLFNTFNSLGGTVGKVNYYTFYQHKRGGGWRPNSDFTVNMGYGNLNYAVNDRLTVRFDFTTMTYNAQQPGGLTDAQFEADPRQSNRERNWFKVYWNLAAVRADYKFSATTSLNTRFFGLYAGRYAVGNLERINRTDDYEERNLLKDDYRNWGNETRLLHRYDWGAHTQALLVGTRYYQGLTYRQQGSGSLGYDADYNYLNPDDLEGSDYRFPSRNVSLFAENIFNITRRFSVTPGARFEYIRTAADGYYKNRVLDYAGNVLAEYKINQDTAMERSFAFFGIGTSYKTSETTELYANISQNYRAVNFNDIRVINPNFRTDAAISDEHGYNIDLGFRGTVGKLLSFDVSGFYMAYNDRIGSVLRKDTLTWQVYRYRTNVADSRSIGIEAFAELDIMQLITPGTDKQALLLFTNLSLIDARYTNSDDPAIDGRLVEQVPSHSLKVGLTYRRRKLTVAYQFAYTAEHYTDATNAEFTATAVNGLIPAYHVSDLSASYGFKWFTLQAGVNNLTDNMYFTRRATGYPGPGIIPSDGRSFYMTVQVKI